MVQRGFLVAVWVLAFGLQACATLGEGGASRLDLIRQRGELRCGVSGKQRAAARRFSLQQEEAWRASVKAGAME